MTSNHSDLRHPGRREAAIALGLAAVLMFVAWLVGNDSDPRRPGVATVTGASGEVIALDTGDTPGPQAIVACLERVAGPSAADVDVLYGTTQRSATGTAPALVLRDEHGRLLLCDSTGADRPSRVPVTYADATHPVRLLSGQHRNWDCQGARLLGFTTTSWLSVARRVGSVRVRFLVDDTAGPWFSAEARDGFARVHGWLGPQAPGSSVEVEYLALDRSGEPVDQEALPRSPRPVDPCAGGDPQLG